jgi:hypothetical protein
MQQQMADIIPNVRVSLEKTPQSALNRIMTTLTAHILGQLEQDFASHDWRMPLNDFVRSMLARLPSCADIDDSMRLPLVRELFTQVDINGDGEVHWQEFTALCCDRWTANTYAPRLCCLCARGMLLLLPSSPPTFCFTT